MSENKYDVVKIKLINGIKLEGRQHVHELLTTKEVVIDLCKDHVLMIDKLTKKMYFVPQTNVAWVQVEYKKEPEIINVGPGRKPKTATAEAI